MNGIYYRNTCTNIPNWVNNLHEKQPIGYAYETETHFVHLYGTDEGLNVISVGLTAIEAKSGTLEEWVTRVFGAQDIKSMSLPVGNSIQGVWRPSLYYYQDIEKALDIDPFEKRSAEQALRVLIEKLDDILLYVEPDANGLNSYGHKSRELLILACTEVENSWTSLFKKANIQPANGRMYTTNDYVKLLPKACLNEFEIVFKNYSGLRKFQPFLNWTASNPTRSLSWYDAYNKTKHDRGASFNAATLENVMDAIAANVVMFCAKYGPFSLFNDNNTLSSLVNQHFSISLRNSDFSTYYIPKITLPAGTRADLFIYDCYREGHHSGWNVQPIVL
ncbi:hypothetical protein AYY26_20940 [Photobacterium phosphoreum]|uniref:hypothetical protein n=1 Tax=Photobacterium phosphoreum TaxID=659 RepID=UPI0007F963A9|nr:hypothetical protein [Photobacterium phosphoreum]OBU41474.1 hypothetical protein AYY26_20940 [Photobacterium phosphoreum]